MQKIKKKNSNKKMKKNILTLIIAITISLIVAEMILHLLKLPPETSSPSIHSDEMAHRYAPNLNRSMVSGEYNVNFQTNSLGLRDNEVSKKNGTRILILGDSFAAGYGVGQGKLFSDLLEKEINIEVVNAGVAGYNLIHLLQYYKNYGKNLNPDLVVYAAYLGNDLTGNKIWILSNNTLRHPDYGYPIKVKRQRIRLFALSRILFRNAAFLKRKIIGPKEWIPSEAYLSMTKTKLSLEAQENYEISKSLIKSLNDEVNNSNAKFLVVLFSYKTVVEKDAKERLSKRIPDLERDYDLDKPMRIIEGFLKDEGIEYINLIPLMKEEYNKNNESLYYYMDGHFNERGHVFFAKMVAPKIKSMVS